MSIEEIPFQVTVVLFTLSHNSTRPLLYRCPLDSTLWSHLMKYTHDARIDPALIFASSALPFHFIELGVTYGA